MSEPSTELKSTFGAMESEEGGPSLSDITSPQPAKARGAWGGRSMAKNTSSDTEGKTDVRSSWACLFSSSGGTARVIDYTSPSGSTSTTTTTGPTTATTITAPTTESAPSHTDSLVKTSESVAGKIGHLVLDSGAIIKGARVDQLGPLVHYLTTPAVISELKDASSRRVIEFFPHLIRTVDPSVESVRVVEQVARLTGDFWALSAVDLRVLALAYEMAKTCDAQYTPPDLGELAKARADLSQTSTHTDTSGGEGAQSSKPKHHDALTDHISDMQVPFLVRAADLCGHEETKEVVEGSGPDGGEWNSNVRDGFFGAIAEDTAKRVVENAEALSTMKQNAKDQNEKPRKAKNKKMEGNAKPKASKQDVTTTTSAKSSEKDTEKSSTQSQSHGTAKPMPGWGDWACAGDSDEGEADGTSDNNTDTTAGQSEVRGNQVACITTDYAMQNVLLRLGVECLSVTGARIKHLVQWIQCCHACSHLVTDMSRQFCPTCGSNTLVRVRATTDKSGRQRIKMPWGRIYNKRGTQYTIPTPKGGRNSKDLVLREDMLINPEKLYARRRRLKEKRFLEAVRTAEEKLAPSRAAPSSSKPQRTQPLKSAEDVLARLRGVRGVSNTQIEQKRSVVSQNEGNNAVDTQKGQEEDATPAAHTTTPNNDNTQTAAPRRALEKWEEMLESAVEFAFDKTGGAIDWNSKDKVVGFGKKNVNQSRRNGGIRTKNRKRNRRRR